MVDTVKYAVVAIDADASGKMPRHREGRCIPRRV